MSRDFYAQAAELVSRMTLEEKIAQMSYDAPAIERLGVPAYNWWNESLHGLARNGCATIFPQAIGMAATFDTAAMKQMSQITAVETRARFNEMMRTFGGTDLYQGITMCCPNINIFRDPRWGRGQETYGEDPFLTGIMGRAFVDGLQGDGEYRMLDTNLKHYAVHSGPEALRHGFSAEVSMQEMYRTYLWAFEYIIEHSDPSAVMGAYSAVNGHPCSGSKLLLKDILRDRFGFKGYVTSDAGSIDDLHGGHKVTANIVESAALALNSGCDLNIGDSFKCMDEAVKQGLVSEEAITEAVTRLFAARYRLGMFDEDCPFNEIDYELIDSEEHRAVNREIARKSIVLLKNDGVLPLKGAPKIAVIGPNADCNAALEGNYCGTASRYITPLRGIQENYDGKVYYSRGSTHLVDMHRYNMWHENPLRDGIINAQKADVVVLCVGITPDIEGEEGDADDRSSIELPEPQQKLCEAILNTGKPVILVNISGSAMALTDYADRCAAVIQCFYPGAEGGNALADVLFGKYNPAGRLPATFYRSTGDLPDFSDYNMDGRTYRFFRGEPLYPFGFGLSYSKFEYAVESAPEKIAAGEDMRVKVSVCNRGDMDGDAVTQIYISRADGRSEDDVIRQLIAIDRRFIRAGETAVFDVEIPAALLTEIDSNGNRNPMVGSFELSVGGTQPDDVSIRLSGLECAKWMFEIKK